VRAPRGTSPKKDVLHEVKTLGARVLSFLEKMNGGASSKIKAREDWFPSTSEGGGVGKNAY